MKAKAQIDAAAGVQTEQYAYATLYEGTREALLAAVPGLLPELFADGSERNKRGQVVRQRIGAIDGREVRTTWLRERGKYSVYVYRNPEEREQFEAADVQRRQNERARDDILRVGPRGRAKACLDGAGISLIMAFNMTDDSTRLYGFSAEAKARVKEHFQKIMWWFENGGFEPRLGAVASGDSEFQRFMARAAPTSRA